MDTMSTASGVFKEAYQAKDTETNADYMLKYSKGELTLEIIKDDLSCYLLANEIVPKFNKAVREKIKKSDKIELCFLDCLAGKIVSGKKEKTPIKNKEETSVKEKKIVDGKKSSQISIEEEKTTDEKTNSKEEEKYSGKKDGKANNKEEEKILSEKEEEPNYVFIERLISGTFTKFNNNYGWSDKDTGDQYEIAQAFSHFSFEYTKGTYLVVDIQGCFDKEKNTLYLTDPAVHSSKFQEKFGATNCGNKGFAKFFLDHKCNKYCEALGLFQIFRILPACVTGDKSEIEDILSKYKNPELTSILASLSEEQLKALTRPIDQRMITYY